MSLIEVTHPRSINFSIVASDSPSMFSAFLDTACEIIPSNLPLQRSFVHINTSVSFSFTIFVS